LEKVMLHGLDPLMLNNSRQNNPHLLHNHAIRDLRIPLLHLNGMMSNSAADINKKHLLGVQVLRIVGNWVQFEPTGFALMVNFHESVKVRVGFGPGLHPDEGWVGRVEGDLHWGVGGGCDVLIFVFDEEVGEGDYCGGDVVEAGGSGESMTSEKKAWRGSATPGICESI
jgi:hypothetical protein